MKKKILIAMFFIFPVFSLFSSVNAQTLMPLMPRTGFDRKWEWLTRSFHKKDDKIEIKPVSAAIPDIKKSDQKKDEITKEKTAVKAGNKQDVSTISKENKKVISPVINRSENNVNKPQNPEIKTEEKSVNAEIKINNNPVKTSKTKNEQNSASETPNITYNDLDIKKIADEIKGDMADERENILADLRVLWQASVEKNETIRFIILKLSNPDGEHDKTSTVKKILSPLANVAPLVGMGSGNSVAGSGSLIGGGLLGSLLSDDSFANSQLSRVTDAELVLMAQEIDNLQQELVIRYYNYLSAVESLRLTDKIVQNRYKYYEAAQNLSSDVLAVSDVFYREALDMQYKARQDVLTARADLEQLTGNDALVKLDENLKKREPLN